ncbi:MAG: hypothetical protein FJ308_10575 [Planctomycetes bacterium]|nr:hypothetical protein [Planctomycetota bacterium]
MASALAADCGIISPNKASVKHTFDPLHGTNSQASFAIPQSQSIAPLQTHGANIDAMHSAVPVRIRADLRLDIWFSGFPNSNFQRWIGQSLWCFSFAICCVLLSSGTELLGFQKSPPDSKSELPKKRPPSAKSDPQPKSEQSRKGETVFHSLELVDGTRLIGLMLGDNVSDVFFACRREWMQTQDPQYPKRAAAIANEERKAYEQLRDRLTPLVAANTNEKLASFLVQDLERAQNWLASETHAESELVLLILPKREVKRLLLPEAPRRIDFFNMAVWAWSKRLNASEDATATSLREDLRKQGIGIELIADTPDLGRRFQAIPQSDSEWTARLALVEYSRVHAIDFQGTQGISIRIDPGKEADVASLLQKTLSQQTSSLLSELLGEKLSQKNKRDERSQNPLAAGTDTRWYDSPRSQLLNPEEHYFRTTEVATDLPSGNVNVRSAFVVKMPDGTWTAIWNTEVDDNTSKGRADSIQRLNEDPQIQSLKNLLGGLGLASDENLNRALQAGASTMQAQQEANYRFEKFRQRYLNQLDVPILRWDPN